MRGFTRSLRGYATRLAIAQPCVCGSGFDESTKRQSWGEMQVAMRCNPLSRCNLLHLGSIAGVWLAFVLALLPVACASAEFSPAQLLSGTSTRQFDSASSPAFSKDRRYVVFRGSLAGVHGIYRR